MLGALRPGVSGLVTHPEPLPPTTNCGRCPGCSSLRTWPRPPQCRSAGQYGWRGSRRKRTCAAIRCGMWLVAHTDGGCRTCLPVDALPQPKRDLGYVQWTLRPGSQTVLSRRVGESWSLTGAARRPSPVTGRCRSVTKSSANDHPRNARYPLSGNPEGALVAPEVHGEPTVSVLAMLAMAGAAVSLWAGAARHSGPVARGYRWLSAAALFWCAGLIIDTVLAGPLSSSAAPLSLADVAPLLALAAFATGVMLLASPSAQRGTPGPVLPGLADGYVMAVALLVIGWVVAFGPEFHRSGERPQTFLLDLLHPLADLAVLGALLPVLTVAWRRVLVPYLALLLLAGADSLSVGARVSGGHPGVLEQLTVVAAACLLALAPWVKTIAARTGLVLLSREDPAPEGIAEGLPGPFSARQAPVTSAGAATIIAAIAVVAAAFAVIVNGLASAPASGLALVIAGGAAVLVVGVRILMLVRENGVAVRMWRESGKSLR